MTQLTDTISWGETYDIQVTITDTEGNLFPLDETWSGSCRVCEDYINGPLVLEPVMTIENEAVVGSIDTGDEPFRNGVYFYDVRVTDSDGNDYWSFPVKLIIEPRSAPKS